MSAHASREHRRFSPSQAERFFNCHGSTNLLARVPARPSSEYAIEGTKAHEVFEAALRNGERRAAEAHREHSSLCMEDLNSFDNLFYYSIQVALNYVYGILDENPDAVISLETYVNPPVESAPGEAGGFLDVAIHVPSKKLLYVIDYKHGAGIAKAVKDNHQVTQYAGGLLFDEDRGSVAIDAISSVVLVIIQPRAFHPDGMVREYELTPYQVWEYLQELDEVIAANLAPDAPLTPGEDQCRFCDAKTVCPAREAQALAVAGAHFKQIEQISQPALPVPTLLDAGRLGFIRQHAPYLRKWLDDVDAHCLELARQGQQIPGAKIVEVQARRKWYGDEKDIAEKAAALAGVPAADLMQVKLMPITQVEKLVVEAFKKSVGRGRKKQAAEEAKQAFAFLTLKQSSGNLVLVDEDDPRPAVTRAADSFAQIIDALQAPTGEQT